MLSSVAVFFTVASMLLSDEAVIKVLSRGNIPTVSVLEYLFPGKYDAFFHSANGFTKLFCQDLMRELPYQGIGGIFMVRPESDAHSSY